MLLALPNGSKGKHHSMQAAATARAGGNAFPIQYVYVSFKLMQVDHELVDLRNPQRSEPLEAIGDGDGANVSASALHTAVKGSSQAANSSQGAAGSKKCCAIL